MIRACIFGLSTLAFVAGNGLAAAADYPQRPIRVVVPSLPGGPPDLIIRIPGSVDG